jgi:hypothetical protein
VSLGGPVDLLASLQQQRLEIHETHPNITRAPDRDGPGLEKTATLIGSSDA